MIDERAPRIERLPRYPNMTFVIVGPREVVVDPNSGRAYCTEEMFELLLASEPFNEPAALDPAREPNAVNPLAHEQTR